MVGPSRPPSGPCAPSPLVSATATARPGWQLMASCSASPRSQLAPRCASGSTTCPLWRWGPYL
eukprot:6388554-Lingulodinium_polyedra.AAC.1